MWTWYSPNGVDHLVEDSGRCATCGRIHDQSDTIAQQLVEDIIAEVDGNLELAIQVIVKTKDLLEQRKTGTPAYTFDSPEWRFDNSDYKRIDNFHFQPFGIGQPDFGVDGR